MKNITINISLPKPLLDAVDKQAKTELRNRSELIREAIRSYLLRAVSEENNTYSKEENARLGRMTELKPLSDDVAIYLSAVLRPQPNSIPELFKGGDSAITQLLENPPTFRRSGWDLRTLDRVKAVAGEYVQLDNGNRKTLKLYRDGQFLFAANHDFLSHGVRKENNENESEFRINSLAVAETITNFTYFIHEYTKQASKEPNKVIVKIRLLNPKKKDLRLISVRRGLSFNEPIGNAVGEESLEREIPITVSKNMNKDMNAYKILAELFYFFGTLDANFRYVNSTEGVVDTKNFREG